MFFLLTACAQFIETNSCTQRVCQLENNSNYIFYMMKFGKYYFVN